MLKKILLFALIALSLFTIIPVNINAADTPTIPDVNFSVSVDIPADSYIDIYGSDDVVRIYGNQTNWITITTQQGSNFLEPIYSASENKFYYDIRCYYVPIPSGTMECSMEYYKSPSATSQNYLGIYELGLDLEPEFSHVDGYHYRFTQPKDETIIPGYGHNNIDFKLYVATVHEHNYYMWETIKYPTCTSSGIDKRKCLCGDYYYTYPSAYGHTGGTATCTELKKCTRCGVSYGAYLDHIFKNGRCTRCDLPDMPTVDASKYTTILNDVGKDADFTLANYPAVSGNYELDLFQISESKDGELFLYVYNPSATDVPLEAKYINMSLQHYENSSPEYKLYSLTKLSSEGTITKYLVNNFNVSSNSTRYYNIAGIYTPYNANIHDPAKADDDIINYIGLPVGKCFEVITSGSTVKYACRKIDYVDAEIIAVGTVRYADGFWLQQIEKTDSHFVAFKVNNFDVTKIYDVDVFCNTKSYHYNWTYGVGETIEEGDPVSQIITVHHSEKGTNEGGGFLGGSFLSYHYKWNRISTLSEFENDLESAANEDLIGFDKTNLAGAEFVIRFLETNYTNTFSSGSYTDTKSTKIDNVTILRMHFATDEGVYNLGVISDIVSDDGNPDFEVTPDDNLGNQIEDIFTGGDDGFDDLETILLLILSLVVIVVVVSILHLLKKLVRAVVNTVSTAIETVINVFKAPFDFVKGKKKKVAKKVKPQTKRK